MPLPLNKLKPEEKVKLSIDMTDACVSVCADAIKDRGVVKEEDVMEQVRERVMYNKRRHHEV
jgi:sulfur relay (sulfurtransferase) complex TusBCD TusD component (DsrE family)